MLSDMDGRRKQFSGRTRQKPESRKKPAHCGGLGHVSPDPAEGQNVLQILGPLHAQHSALERGRLGAGQ